MCLAIIWTNGCCHHRRLNRHPDPDSPFPNTWTWMSTGCWMASNAFNIENLCGFDLFQSELNPNSDPLFLLNDSMRLFAVKNRSVKLSPKISRAKALGMISRLFVRQPGAPLDHPFH